MMIAVTATLTVLVEAAVLMLDKRNRRWQFLLAATVINVTTNVLLNLSLQQIDAPLTLTSWQVLLGEAIVWFTEFAFYGCLFSFSWCLLALVVLANAITYSMSALFLAFS